LARTTECIDARQVNRVRKHAAASSELHSLAELFKVLGDPTRVAILHALSLSELCVCDIAAVVGMSSSAVSHQLRVLRMARLVRSRKERKLTYYSLDDEHVRTLLKQGLGHVKEK
jgi:DNA-binding transcriptional ArsR family regulator